VGAAGAGLAVRGLARAVVASVDISPRVVATATSLDAVAAMVSAGLGVSLLPRVAFRSLTGSVVFRAPADVDWLIEQMARLAGGSSPAGQPGSTVLVAAVVDDPAGGLHGEVGGRVGQLDALGRAGVRTGGAQHDPETAAGHRHERDRDQLAHVFPSVAGPVPPG